jgi:hypothetical protein
VDQEGRTGRQDQELRLDPRFKCEIAQARSR